MDGFRVVTEQLTAAAQKVAGSKRDLGASERAISGSAGALAGTPAQSAYETFVGDANKALSGLDEVVGGISRSLSEAAYAYMASDMSAAGSLRVGKGR